MQAAPGEALKGFRPEIDEFAVAVGEQDERLAFALGRRARQEPAFHAGAGNVHPEAFHGRRRRGKRGTAHKERGKDEVTLKKEKKRAVDPVKSRCGQHKPNRGHGALLLLGLAVLILAGFPEAASTAKTPPFDAFSRTLSYNIFWNGVPAGKATLQVARSGDEARVTLAGRTEALLNAVYPLKINAESRLLAESLAALRYEEKTREGRAKEKTELLVFGGAKGTVDVFKNGRHRRTLNVPAGTVDPLGGVYRFLETAQRQRPLHITDGRRVFEVLLSPARHEEVSTPTGARSAQVWDVAMKVVSGKPHVLEKSSARVWTLEDQPSVLLKAVVTLPYGVFSTQIADAG